MFNNWFMLTDRRVFECAGLCATVRTAFKPLFDHGKTVYRKNRMKRYTGKPRLIIYWKNEHLMNYQIYT